MDCGRFSREIINHVLIVFPNASCIIESFTIESKAYTIRTVRYIEVLRPDTTYYSGRSYFDTVSFTWIQFLLCRFMYRYITQ